MAVRDPYFALADPTRRAILDLLWEDGATPAGAVAARFAAISREAVSRHLRVLREAGLVRVTIRGREFWYALDPAPLAAMHEAFFARFVPAFDASLAALESRVEAEPAIPPGRAADHPGRRQPAPGRGTVDPDNQ